MTQAQDSEAAAAPRMPSFLTAEWRHLVMLNYEVSPEVLLPWLPKGAQLDTWEGKSLASIVAFQFLETRVLGMEIPGYRDFHEVNLRFYVRRQVGDDWRRGVVFVKELVPKRAIAWTARFFYGERYQALRMNGSVWHGRCEQDPVSSTGQALPDWTTHIHYWWRVGGSYEGLYAECSGEPSPVMDGSQAWFITDQGWGYTSRRGVTLEYQVEHPRWRVWEKSAGKLDCDVGRLYGERFGAALKEPCSVLVAEGSPVVVRRGRRIAG